MLQRIFPPAVLAALLSAQASDPISDRLRYEIAAAQRDLVIAKQHYDAAAAMLKQKMEDANKLCAGQDAVFEPVSFTCKTERKKP